MVAWHRTILGLLHHAQRSLTPLGYLSDWQGLDRGERRLRIASNWITTAPGDVWETHSHPDHELLWGTDGTVIADVGSGSFAVPARHGLWIPAYAVHRVVNVSASRLHCTWLQPDALPTGLEQTRAVPTSALFRDVLEHLRLGRRPMPQPDVRRRAEQFAFDLLGAEWSTVRAHEWWLPPMPTSPSLRTLAEAMQQQPGAAWTVSSAARLAGMSERTLRRHLADEIGIGFAQWRRQQRVHAGMHLLADGKTVAATARRVGYRTANAFTSAFTTVTGVAPAAYARSRIET